MTAGPPREARYANLFYVGVNEAELVIDFAQAYEGEPSVVHTRIVTSPSHGRELAAMLFDALGSIEAVAEE